MSNLSELCQKSVADVVEIINNKQILSPSYAETIKAGKKILFVIDKDVPKNLIDALLSEVGSKEYKIITPFQYNAKKYDFFGITKGHVPVLIDEEFLLHDTVIAVSFVKYHHLLGYTGGKNLIFTGLAPEKSLNSLYKKSLDNNTKRKSVFCRAGVMQNNMADSQCLDAAMIIRQNTYYFGINLIGDIDNNIVDVTCGDLFMAHIKGAEIFSSIYPLQSDSYGTGKVLTLGNSSLQEEVSLIDEATIGLQKGGRLFIDGSNLKSIGSEKFIETFYTNSLDDIFNKLIDDFSVDMFYSFLLKDICSMYHLAIVSDLDANILRQSGLNIISSQEKNNFLKDCNNVCEVFNANGFTANRKNYFSCR